MSLRGYASIFVLLWSALLPLTGSAQVSASLSGRVTDQTGAVISGATVRATNQETGLVRSTQTESAGRYELTALPVGQYEISAVKDGFAERIRSGISLVIGQDATVDLSLAVGEVPRFGGTL
jgi:hypothetical protein